MSVMALAQPDPFASSLDSLNLYRISVLEYEKICEMLDDDRVELIDGLMVRKMGKNPPRAFATMQLADWLARTLPEGMTWRQELPVRLSKYDQPEPDFAIVRGSNYAYRGRQPEAADVVVVIEISDSLLKQDQNRKRILYAIAAIPTYWIVNLVENQVEVYSSPSDKDYQPQQIYKRGQAVPLTIDGVDAGSIAVAELLV